jgi:azurin
MDKKTMYYVVAGVVLVLAIGIIIAMQSGNKAPNPVGQNQPAGGKTAESETDLNQEIADKLNLSDGQLPLRVTIDDNGQSLSATPGKNLSLMLGTDYDWTITSSDDGVLAKRAVALDDARVQAVYQVVGEGTAVLSAQGKCKSGAKCAAPTASFVFTVDGLISENIPVENLVK